jgi:alpha 1,2-mannosyltransferase
MIIPRWRYVAMGGGALVSPPTHPTCRMLRRSRSLVACARPDRVIGRRGARFHPGNQALPSKADPQLMVHLLLSIHPTYRATTSPFNYLPSGNSGVVNGMGDGSAVPPDDAVPVLTGKKRPGLDELNGDALEGRRKANAAFVVLG